MTPWKLEGYWPTLLVEEVLQDGTSTWYAEHPDLPGCHGVGASQPAAQEDLDRNREAWLKWAGGHDVDIPSPGADPMVSTVYAPRPAAAQTITAAGTRESIPVNV